MSLSDLFSRFLEFIGSELSPAESLSAEPPKPQATMRLQTELPPGKYAPIREAVEGRLEHLVSQEIPEHRQLAEDDILELHYVEIESAPEGQALLDEFCKEFSPSARQAWVRKFFGNNPAVKLDGFARVFRSADLPPTANLDPHLQLLNLGSSDTYRVRLWSRWVQAPKAAPPLPRRMPSVRGPAIVLRIYDSRGSNPEIRRETYPIEIGRLGEVVVDGTYVSAEHCTLRCYGGQVELEDHSKNGTWVDGAELHGQTRPLSLGVHRLKLGKGQGEAKDWPEIDLKIIAETVTPIAEPTAVASALATPIAADGQAVLAVLSIQDATGNPRRDVLELPFSIGRSADRDYVTPPAHAGVSGHHLVIEAIHEEGADVFNMAHAKNSTALEGILQGERFLWPFDQTISLAPKWKHAEPVLITLQRPA